MNILRHGGRRGRADRGAARRATPNVLLGAPGAYSSRWVYFYLKSPTAAFLALEPGEAIESKTGSAIIRAMRGPKDLSSIVRPGATALLVLLLYAIVGRELMLGFRLDIGRSLNEPSPIYGRFLALWTVFGALAAGALALAIVRAWGTEHRTAAWLAHWRAASDGKWLAYGTLFALVIPAALRHWLLVGMPLTDDESAYRFMAHVLASGHLFADSPPFKLFFDNRFLINDGKVFAPYFVGWPTLMAPGAWLGITGYMNAFYSALTVPALWLVSKRLAGGDWARLALLLYLTAPMLMIGAATEASHTSCLMALTWLTWLVLRSGDKNTPIWVHGAVTGAFSIAFFIRPTSALGIGGPLLVWWLWQRFKDPRRIVAMAMAAVPALLFAGAFLAVNQAQTGSPLTTGYQRHGEYAWENDFRFAMVSREEAEATEPPSAPKRLALAAIALFRLNHDLFGWPSSLLLILFVSPGRWRRLLFATAASYFAVHWIVHDVGIDTFAPMHYFELALPLLLLTVLGLRDLSSRFHALERQTDALEGEQSTAAGDVTAWRWRALPSAAAAALIVVSLIGFWPVRAGAVGAVARNVAMPHEALDKALDEAGINRAVIFTLDPFVRFCRKPPVSGWVFSRPDNHPQLTDDILWLNHVSLETDRLFLRRTFPDYRGYLMAWDRSCQVRYLPLESLQPGSIPPAPVSGIDELLAALQQP